MSFGLPLNPDTNPWIMEWILSPEYSIAALCITITQSVILPILFVLHFYRLKDGSRTPTYKDNALQWRYKVIDRLALCAILLSFLSGILTSMNYLKVVPHSGCTAMTITQNLCWMLTKVSIYEVVILRLQACFWSSAYEINARFINLCSMFILLFIIIMSIGSLMDIRSVPVPQTGFCLLIIPTWLILLPTLFDVICSTLSVVLFVNAIQNLLKHAGSRNSTLVNLVTKYILISLIAVLSNLFSSFWFAITDILIFTYLDVFINPVCLILMQIHHEDLYMILCRWCHQPLSKIIHFERELSTNEKGIVQMQQMQQSEAVSPASTPISSPPSDNE